MTNKSMLFSLDYDTIEYIESIPKTKRSLVVREALELHKFRHRQPKDEKTTQKKELGVKLIG